VHTSQKSSEPAVPVLECRNVTKRFHHYEHRRRTLQEFVLDRLRSRNAERAHGHFELFPFDLTVERGESVALIGSNGSGKSTVLRLMAGIYPPTEGQVVHRGRVAAVIELGTTFQPELTGDENVELYAAALGLGRRQIMERREIIFDFSGVAEFRDVPLKYYSSGMRSRLAFAIAAHAEPDILLLDEVLAVGDHSFRSKCYERLQQFNAEGGTLIVVTHDLDAARDLCRRGIWLERGRITLTGAIDDVIAAYQGADA
jgi:homopolymeric O-antigen transport system ATP-binding protein